MNSLRREDRRQQNICLATEPILSEDNANSFNIREFNSNFIELAIRIGLIGFLIYWSFTLVQPFAPMIVWSIVLSVALYPAFEWLSFALGGRRRWAAVIITVLGLVVVIGPVTWIGVGLIDALRSLLDQLESGELSIPPPRESVKDWPIVGAQIHDFWALASTNVHSAIDFLFPYLKPYGESLLDMAKNTSAGMLKFLLSVIIAGFLFSPGPQFIAATKAFARRINPARGEIFVSLAGSTIRAVSRGVIGLSLLQAIIAGIGMTWAAVPGASLLAITVLLLGIIQLGPLIVVAPVIIWGWANLGAGAALGLTICMLTVNFMDNFLKPFLLSRGLTTPTIVIFVGVIGGVLAHGIAGLFAGPVVLAVAWDLAVAWMQEGSMIDEAPQPR
jgi:predicted PurR-regulated permease PerM